MNTKTAFLIASVIGISACKYIKNAENPASRFDHMVSVKYDSVTRLKMSDTLVIFENTCRGCAYENTTKFVLNDTTSVVKLYDIITEDNSPPNMSGGTITKILLITPQKPGKADVTLYKYYEQEMTARDSASGQRITIEVVN